MTNQTDLISEVRAALQAATDSPLARRTKADDHLMMNAPTWLQQLTDRLGEAVKALEWYGDEKVWTVDVEDQWHPFTQIGADGGKLARATLKRIKGENS